jgi:2',3'-cyclic-nucleotide 2'-phosphodiesterase (5'-nucleotidase family)
MRTAALLIALVAATPAPPSPISYPKKMTILHTNDIHAHMEETNSGGTSCSAKDIAENKCYGGAARMKTVIDAYRANTTDVILMVS